MPAIRLLDLFCGTGAFSKGFENATNAEYQTLFGIDTQQIAIATFLANHPCAKAMVGDIRRTTPSEISELIHTKPGEIDIIIGGPPCQGFSSIRPFRSAKQPDPRNSLFEDFARFITYFRPKVFILENVVGLATYNNGDTIIAIEERMHHAGYDCDWRIMNAAHFGVPQRRERLIFVGTQRGGQVIFPRPTYDCDLPTIGYKQKQRLLLPPQPDLFSAAAPLLPAITVMDAIGDLPQISAGELATVYDTAAIHCYQQARRKETVDLTLHVSTRHTTRMIEIIKYAGSNINAIPKHLISSGFSSCYSRLDAHAPSVTITVNFVHPASNRGIHPTLDRALTPREGARLQSFDDDFVFCGNRTQITKQIGNAVPPLLGKALAEALAPLLV